LKRRGWCGGARPEEAGATSGYAPRLRFHKVQNRDGVAERDGRSARKVIF
jgi:hypothetical protein